MSPNFYPLPLMSDVAHQTVTKAIYYDLVSTHHHPSIKLDTLAYGSGFFKDAYRVFQKLAGGKLDKSKFSFLLLAFLHSSSSESNANFTGITDMWPGLDGALSKIGMTPKDFEKSFTRFAASVSNAALNEHAQKKQPQRQREVP